MIRNFELYNPTKLIFGKDKIKDLGHYLPKDKKILLLYGKGSIKKNGIYDEVTGILKDYDYIEYGGVEANPYYETLMPAIELCKKENIGFILAVGGGSVIDGAKFVAAGIKYKEGDPWDILIKHVKITESTPIGAILTLPATGSEMNGGSVISKKATQEKFAFGSPLSNPKFSILDTDVLKSLPERQIANGIIDAFVHTTEQYMTYPIGAKLQDRFAESILKTLVEEGPKFLADNYDEDAGANIMFCATMALNGTISAGVPTDWSIHSIGHELTALYGIDHGRTLAIILPSLYKTKLENKKEKLAQFGERVWCIKEGTTEEKALKAIEKTEEFFNSLGVPTKLHEYGSEIDKEFTVNEILSRFKNRGISNIGEDGILSLNDMEKILTSCF
ncbi:MAG: iron-containing alcohol dehydrogenase [Saprospiraceae bacterium]